TQGQKGNRVQISPPQRLSPHSRPSTEADPNQDHRHQPRRENFEGEKGQDRGEGVISWLIKKDRAASRTAGIASANGWASRSLAAKRSSRATSSFGSAGRSFCPARMWAWAGITPSSRWSMARCILIAPGDG